MGSEAAAELMLGPKPYFTGESDRGHVALSASFLLIYATLAAIGRDVFFNHNLFLRADDDVIGHYLPYIRVAVCLIAVLTVTASSGLTWGLSKVPLLFAPYCVYALLSSAWSVDVKDTLRASLTLIAACVAMSMIIHRIGMVQAVRLSLNLTAWVCIFSFLLAIFVPAIGRHNVDDLIQAGHAGQWRGIFSHKNGLGPWAAYGATLILFYGDLMRAPPLFRWGSWVCALACLIFANSVTSWLLALSCVVIFFAIKATRKVPVLWLLNGFTILALCGACIATLQPELMFAALGRDTSLSGRRAIWQFAMRAVRERPWFGYGYQTLGGADCLAREQMVFLQPILGPGKRLHRSVARPGRHRLHALFRPVLPRHPQRLRMAKRRASRGSASDRLFPDHPALDARGRLLRDKFARSHGVWRRLLCRGAIRAADRAEIAGACAPGTPPACPALAPGVKDLDVLIVTPLGRGGMGGIDRIMDAVGDELAAHPIPHLDVRFSVTRGQGAITWSAWHVAATVLRVFGVGGVRPSLAHVNLSSFGSFYRKRAVTEACRLAGVPYCLHLHGSEFDVFWSCARPVLAKSIRRMFEGAASTVVLGQKWRDFVCTQAPDVADRIVILPNATPRGPDRTTHAPGPTRILFLGRAWARAKACRSLSKLSSGLAVVPIGSRSIAGDGDVEATRQRLANAGLSARVGAPGWVGPRDVERLLSQADILVLPSHEENLPMSVIEGMAYGCAIVATPAGSTADILATERNGLLVPPGDIEALTLALERLLDDPPLRLRLGAAAQAFHRERLDIAVYVRELARVWREVAETAQRQGTAARTDAAAR